MRTLEDIRPELRAMLPDLRPRWPITRLGVFGSYARGEQHEGSGLDLLVDLDQPLSFFEFLELGQELGRWILRELVPV